MSTLVTARCATTFLLLVAAGPPGNLLAQVSAGPVNRPGQTTMIVDSARTAGGYYVRTLLNRPAGAAGRLPALLFVQWLSCDTVELPAEGGDGWSLTLRTLIERAGVVVARTEKPGVGASGGPPCDQMGYQEELAAHRAALAALRASPWVHPDSIYLFGASMGGTMAPLLADDRVRGIVVWGTTGVSWLEHLALLDRRVFELQGAAPESTQTWMADQIRFLTRYLAEAQDPRTLTAADAAMSAAWRRMIGTTPGDQYGRPFRFHQEAQAAGWEAAWGRVRVPVLVLRGEYDWLMTEPEHRRIVAIVNRAAARAKLVTLPGMDHNFSVYPSQADAFAGTGGLPDTAAVPVILAWLDAARRGAAVSLAPPGAGAFTESLWSTGPDSALAGQLHDFGQLVGSWDLVVTWYPDSAPPQSMEGEWHFAWVLEGRAVQDVWRVPRRGPSPGGELRGFGTTLRVYDPSIGAWRSTWIGALNNRVTTFLGRRVGAEIVLEPEPAGAERFRWVFFDIQPDRFRWRAESTTDGGATWRVQQEMRAHRRVP